MEKVIENPTREQLVALFLDAGNAANGKGRVRTLDCDRQSGEAFATLVLSAPHGCEQWDGGGVANAYRQAAETSVLAFAWYTRPDGVRVVRVKAARIRVFGRQVKNLNLGDRRQQAKLLGTCPAALVYEDVFGCYSGAIHFGGRPSTTIPRGFVAAVKKQPADATAWLVLADWLEENDRADTAARIRSAFLAPTTTGS